MTPSLSPVWMEALARAPGLEEIRPLRIARATLLALSGTVLALLVWAGLTPVNVVTRSYGQIMPSGYVQVIQHLEGGIVQEIRVREGQRVAQGDVLMVMNPTSVASDVNQLKQQQWALLMEHERTQAFLEGREPDFSQLSGADPQMLEEQVRAYESTLSAKQREAEVIGAQIRQRREALHALQARAGALAKNITLGEESLGIKRNLYEKGYYSRLNFLEKQEEVNHMRGEQAAIYQDIQRTKSEIGEYESRLSSLDANTRERSYDTLTRLNNDIAKNEEAIAKYADRLARLEVRSPVNGIVKGVEVTTIGGIVAPGQKLMEVVPLDDTLTVEARIRPSDVGQLHAGLPVRVKVHAFDYTRYGGVEGTLEGISATTFVDEKNQNYFRGTVALGKDYAGSDPAKNKLVPGMTVDAEIIAGERSLLSYLLKPVRAAADTSFTER